MGYLRRKDGTLQTVNGEYVPYHDSFVTVDANTIALGQPLHDLNEQKDLNEFLLSQVKTLRGLPQIWTANTQTYNATNADYEYKFGPGATGVPVQATRSDAYSYVSQAVADARAMHKARVEVVSMLRYRGSKAGNALAEQDDEVAPVAAVVPTTGSLTAADVNNAINAISGRHKGAWTPSASYLVNDMVAYNGNTYYAKEAHASGSGFNASKWNAMFSTFTPASIKAAVTSGSFVAGELIGITPAGSVSNMRFIDASWRYEYMHSAADTDGTLMAWVRTVKI